MRQNGSGQCLAVTYMGIIEVGILAYGSLNHCAAADWIDGSDGCPGHIEQALDLVEHDVDNFIAAVGLTQR